MNRVFHYTSRNFHLPMIIQSGELRPSAAGGMVYERPLVWFSKNPVMEHTAAGASGLLGCVRFALPAHDKRLMKWDQACERAGIKSHWRDALELVGRNMGADPNDWLAIDGNVALHHMTLEVLEGETWVPMELEAMS